MASQAPATNGAASNDFTVKAGLAQMLKGGVIMDVVNAEQVYTHYFRQLTKALTLLGSHCGRGRCRRCHGP